MSEKTTDEIRKAMVGLPPAMPGYGRVWWNEGKKTIWFSLGDSDERETYDAWLSALKSVEGVEKVDGDAESFPKGDDWQEVKRMGPYESLIEDAYTDRPDPSVKLGFAQGHGIRIIFSFDRSHGKHVSANLSPYSHNCGSVRDYQIVINSFRTRALAFLQKYGLTPIGEPMVCNDRLVWRYKGEIQMESSFSHAAVQSRLAQRRANPRRQQAGRVAAHSFSKAGGQRRGQRQSRRSRS